MNALKQVIAIAKREQKRMLQRGIYTFCMVIAPIMAFLFFTTLMGEGLPADLPAGVVDEDNTATTREVIRNLDSFQQTNIIEHYADVAEARKAMQQGKIYAFYYIPEGTTQLAISGKQPTVSFYTAASYLIPASLEYRDMKMMSEYASGAVGRATLYAKGYTEDQAMAVLQPIKMEMHAINNPSLNYSVYLCNTILPGIIMLLIMQVSIYSIYVELKEETSKEWLAMADNDIVKALAGKLLPQIVTWSLMGLFCLFLLYGVWRFPLHSGIWPMILNMFLLINASLALGVFFCGLVPSLRWALSLATLWGVLSFPISGFSFPQMAFPDTLKGLSWLFPLRHYYLIYVDQALNGLPLYYSWLNIAIMIGFLALPILVIWRLQKFLLEYHYTH